MKRYEYDFVRLGEGWFSVQRKSREAYQEVVRRKASGGWRLVQIFAPGIGVYGAPKYYELIFEREVA